MATQNQNQTHSQTTSAKKASAIRASSKRISGNPDRQSGKRNSTAGSKRKKNS